MVTTKTHLRDRGKSRKSKIALPLAPDASAVSEMEIYARFMRHIRMVANSRAEIKILSAIQFTADMLDLSDALISKTLVDLGLRAPRSALPTEYLDYIDQSLMRSGWDIGGPKASTLALKKHWDYIGEDRFAACRAQSVLTYTEASYV